MSSLGLGPAPPSRLAANPENEIEIRLSCFCFPTLRQRAPVPDSFRLIDTDSSSGVDLGGMLPTETGDLRVSRRAVAASADRFRTRGLVRPTHARERSTSDAPVAILPRYRGAPFAVRAGPIRRVSPRPLPPRRRETTKLFPVQSAFYRHGVRGSWSALSSGDCAPCTPWNCPARAPPRVPSCSLALADGRTTQAGTSVVLRTLLAGNQSFRRLRLPPPRVASQRRASF